MYVPQRDSGRVNRDALATQLLAPLSGTDRRRYGFELPARVECVARTGKPARTRLNSWGIGGDAHDTAMPVVSEPATNAVVHTDGRLFACELLNGAERLRITVRDQRSAPTHPRVCHTGEEERGRGLLLAEAVSSTWGAYRPRSGQGRVVWADLPYDAEKPC
jgi:hypothetical protein